MEELRREVEVSKIESKLIRAHVIIEGRVQKVFYRLNTLDEAKDLGLSGWVKNCDDGSVEATFEGTENLVKEMLLWCKEGPRLAKVKNMTVTFDDATSEFNDFVIVH